MNKNYTEDENSKWLEFALSNGTDSQEVTKIEQMYWYLDGKYGDIVGLNDVAKELNISTRTLRKQLDNKYYKIPTPLNVNGFVSRYEWNVKDMSVHFAKRSLGRLQ